MKQNRKLSYSALKQFAISPNHLIEYWNRTKESTPQMVFGTLLHTLILEADKFEETFAIWTGGRRAGNEYKIFCDHNKGKEIIKEEEVDKANIIIDRIKNNILLKKKKGAELYINWKQNKVDFHGYVDAYGDGFILDVKTTSDASPRAFLRDFVKFKYYWQAALYLSANEKINFAGPNPDFFILAVETSTPYNSQIYKVTPEFIDKGTKEVNKTIENFKEWDGNPAGYEYYDLLSDGLIMDLNLPEWL